MRERNRNKRDSNRPDKKRRISIEKKRHEYQEIQRIKRNISKRKLFSKTKWTAEGKQEKNRKRKGKREKKREDRKAG